MKFIEQYTELLNDSKKLDDHIIKSELLSKKMSKFALIMMIMTLVSIIIDSALKSNSSNYTIFSAFISYGISLVSHIEFKILSALKSVQNKLNT